MATGVAHLIWGCWVTCTLHVCVMSRMWLYVYLSSLFVIKFVSLSEFIRYQAIKVPPTNYFNNLRGACPIFMGEVSSVFGQFGPSCLLKLGQLRQSCLGPTFFMGRVVQGWLVFGQSCPEPFQRTISKKYCGRLEWLLVRWHTVCILWSYLRDAGQLGPWQTRPLTKSVPNQLSPHTRPLTNSAPYQLGP